MSAKRKGKASGKSAQAAAVLAAMLGSVPVEGVVHEQSDERSGDEKVRRRARVSPVREGGEQAGQAESPGDRARGRARSEQVPERTWTDVNPKLYPKKHVPGALKRGDSVWYRGSRFWVEYCPPSWEKGCHARIVDKAVHPDISRPLPSDAGGPVVTFCVHCDLLDLAPQNRNIYGRQPTLADVARKERTARGQRDVGDEIAQILREAGTLDGCYRSAAEFLGVPERDLRDRYSKLNPGQQRMNLGNRMRNHAKKRHV